MIAAAMVEGDKATVRQGRRRSVPGRGEQDEDDEGADRWCASAPDCGRD